MLNLSTTTVSNVIHGKTKEVSPETIVKVRDFLEKYNYVPNIHARNLAQNESKIIGVAMKARADKYQNFMGDPFVAELIGGIEKTTRRLGYFMMPYISNDIGELINQVSTWNTDGLLLLGMLGDDCIRIREKFRNPFVCIDTYPIRDFSDFVNVGLEDEKSTYAMVQYMIKCGHRKIAFLADNCIGVDYERFKGYRKALREAGIRYEEKDFLMFQPGPEERDRSLEELCGRVKNYTAVFCASDYYAILMMNALSDRGVRVPEDISISGFDDNLLAQTHRPRLTTVHQDVEHKGVIAAETLVKLLHGEKLRKKKICLSTELMLRDTISELNNSQK